MTAQHRPIPQRLPLAHQLRVGQHIRAARWLLGLSAGGLYRRMGNRSEGNSVIMIELGTRPLTLGMFRRIADALDLTPGQLWRGDLRRLQRPPSYSVPDRGEVRACQGCRHGYPERQMVRVSRKLYLCSSCRKKRLD